VQSLIERTIQLNAVKYVDQIICYQTEEELLELLKFVRPNIRIIGSDYEGINFTGKYWCKDAGIEIYFNSRDHGWSSSELRARIKEK
jgi:glycerol-3-phosphate cytidylyltransferase